jgi:GTP-binding protein Era
VREVERTDGLEGYRCGYVALAGQPNVGKSTLLNALVGEHLSIVSPKAQTTRERVAGILSTDRFQILFIDAPGLIEPRYALQEAMRWAAGAAMEESDVIAFISDATRPDTLPDETLAKKMRSGSVPVLVAVNKIDLVDEAKRETLRREIERRGFPALALSALSEEGLADFLECLVPLLPESPPLFPIEDSATQPVRFFVQEFVRETCMEVFRDEIPYSVACRVDEFREDQDPIYIRVIIYVERESQKGIVIGKGGSAIKKVGELSRVKIEELVGNRVYLELRVKVMPGWSRKYGRLQQLGFRLPPNAGGGQKAR